MATSIVHGLATVGCLALGSPAGAAPVFTTAPKNVRASNARLSGALRDSLRKSPTLRTLVGVLDASDVIVYLRAGECGEDVVACTQMAGRFDATCALRIHFKRRGLAQRPSP